MKSKFTVVEDTFTDYLEQLQTHFHEQEKNLLRNAGNTLVENYIEKRIPEWNPNLIDSGRDSENWKFNLGEGRSTLEIMYTGMTDEAIEGDLDKGVWWEFGDQATKTLQRDYAYFQETGVDIWAMPPDAKHKWYVANSVWEGQKSILHDISRYMETYVMKLKEVPTTDITY